ncbi:MAG: uroporphyrinogen decarboxylase family protein [Bacilli bacterium]|jgi:uroporphyrinogen decarboxylase
MNGCERTKAAIKHQKIDRFPVFPILLAPACQMFGVNQRDFLSDSKVLAKTLLQARDYFDFDGIYVSRDNWVYHEALGGHLEYPDDDETFSKEVLLDSIKDFRKLSIPDPWTAPGMKTVLAAAKEIVEKTDNQYYIQANIDSGPFSLGAILRGTQNFLFDLYDEEKEALDAFLNFCTDVVITYGKAMIETGVHGIQMGEANASLIDPNLFNEFVFPYLKRALDELQSDHCDRWVHICGNTKHLLPDLQNLPMEGFEVDALVDLATAKNLIGNKIAVKGNLDTSELLFSSADKVFNDTHSMLENYPLSTGLVVSAGCGVPRMTTPENLLAMVKANKKFSIHRK